MPLLGYGVHPIAYELPSSRRTRAQTTGAGLQAATLLEQLCAQQIRENEKRKVSEADYLRAVNTFHAVKVVRQ